MPEDRSKRPGGTPPREPSSATRPTPLAKGRVTPRPIRPVRTKKRRMNSTRLLYIIGGVGVSVLMLVSFVLPNLTSLGSPQADPNKTDQDPPGVYVAEMKDNEHIANGKTASYSSTPPTSGQHYEAALPWGVYDDPVRTVDELATHNLEHSGVVISYNLSDQTTIASMRNALLEWPLYPCYVIVRPYDKIPAGTVALAAWTKLDGPLAVGTGPLDQATKDRIIEFLEAYAGGTGRTNAPELFRCDPQPRTERTPYTVSGADVQTPAAPTPTPQQGQAETPTPAPTPTP